MTLFDKLANRLIAVADRRPPDFVIGEERDPYLRRWWLLPRNPVFNIYLHHFMRSDDDRALHDHPWINVSVLLRGSYLEVTPRHPRHYPEILSTRLTMRSADHWRLRFAARLPSAAHRVALLTDSEGRPVPVWTLFITGPRVREWGFLCPKGWRPWQKFVENTPGGNKTGRGCN